MESRFAQVALAAFVLLAAAGVLLGLGSRRWFVGQNPATQLAASPVPAVFNRSPAKPASGGADAQSLLSQLPLIFEPNQGQADARARFVSRGSGYSLYLDATGATLVTAKGRPSGSLANHAFLPLEAVRMTLVGANRFPLVTGKDLLPGTSNYFLGNDPQRWHTSIAEFAGVRYGSVYPGIDLVFYGHQGRLEYDFKVAPGADPARAELQFDGATGLELSHGDLILKGTSAGVRLQAPHIYQTAGGRQQPVEGHFVLRSAKRVGFAIGAYDRSRELVIDPVISYSTYFGGSGSDIIPHIAVNGSGAVYLAASTTSANLPLSSAGQYQGTLNGSQNVFIAELSPGQGALGLLGMTYLGGSGFDSASGVAVDGGAVYVAGTTTSTNFPTVAGYTSPNPITGGQQHVFVSKLSPALTALEYSTYLAGNGVDVASAMTIDSSADVFVTGTTTSTDAAALNTDVFPATYLPQPYQPTSHGPIQFFVSEVNTNSLGVASIAYSTYFGGITGTVAIGGGIAVDTTGNVYFSGTTNFINTAQATQGSAQNPNDFPILNAYQPCLDTPAPTTFTYPVTCNTAIAAPVPTDAFVAKLNPANAQVQGSQLVFSTYLGGSANDSSTGLAIDAGASGIYITGSTNSADFTLPTGGGSFQTCLDTPVNVSPCPAIPQPAPTDAFVARFSNISESSGTTTTPVALGYFSYLGGTADDAGLAITVDTASGALLTGWTQSGVIGQVSTTTGFPVTVSANFNPIQSALSGPQNAFFARINTSAVSGTNAVASYATYFGGNGTDQGTTIAVDPSLNAYFAGDTNSTNLQVQGAYQATLNGTRNTFAVKLLPTSNLCISCVLPTFSNSSAVIGAGNPITITYTLLNQGPDLATNITVTGSVPTGATFTSATAGSGICSAPTGGNGISNIVCTVPSLQSGSTSSIAFVVTPSVAGNFPVTATVSDSNNTNSVVSYQASFTATRYSMYVSPSSQTVLAGNPAVYNTLVTPTTYYGNNVSLTCSALPTGASCGFGPSTLNFNGPGALSSTLTLTTTARPINTISALPHRAPFYALWLMFPGMALAGAGKRWRGKLLAALVALTMFALMLFLPACSKAKQQQVVSGTPAGTYPITVTATSGSFTQSYGITLTVQ